MATHLPAWQFTDKVGSIGGVLVVLAMLYFAIRITAGLLTSESDPPPATEDGRVGLSDATG